MKKLTTLLAALFAVLTASAQLITAKDLNAELDRLYPDGKWLETAMALSHDFQLDDAGYMSFEKIIECPGSKSDLYVAAHQWFTSSFDNAKNAITLSDKEAGTIIAQPIVAGVVEHTGGLNHYVVNLQPVIRVDIKEGKVRMKYTLQNYDVGVVIGGGFLGDYSTFDDFDEVLKWPIKDSYPYVEKDKQKKTSSKAFVCGYVYSRVVMQKFEDTMKKTKSSADDNW